MKNTLSGLRIATAVLVSSFALLTSPALAAADVESAVELGQLNMTERFSDRHLEAVDIPHAADTLPHGA